MPFSDVVGWRQQVLQNIGILPQHFTASQPIRPQFYSSTNSLEQSLSQKANSHTASLDISYFYETQGFIIVFTRAHSILRPHITFHTIGNKHLRRGNRPYNHRRNGRSTKKLKQKILSP
jgi:hypothetical protein